MESILDFFGDQRIKKTPQIDKSAKIKRGLVGYKRPPSAWPRPKNSGSKDNAITKLIYLFQSIDIKMVYDGLKGAIYSSSKKEQCKEK